jgi:hypothetical protein
MASKLRTYAENELGVHKVHETAEKARGEIVGEHTGLLEARSERRRITEEIADREAEIWRELRNQHPELSATALDGKAKLERRTDPDLRALRNGLSDAQFKEESIELRIKDLNRTIDIATARMIQLGGYFPFLVKIMEQDAVAHQNTP